VSNTNLANDVFDGYIDGDIFHVFFI